MTEPNSIATQRKTTRARIVLIGAVIPALIALVASVIMLSWIPELPDPVAIHWSGAEADGFGPPWLFPAMLSGIVVVYCAFAILSSWNTTSNGLLSPNQKIMVVSGVWMSLVLSLGMGSTLHLQRGLVDATQTIDSSAVLRALIISAIVGFIIAAGAWFLLPASDRLQGHSLPASPLDVSAQERVSWSGNARLARGAWAVIVVTFALTAAVLAFAVVTAPRGLTLVIAGMLALSVLLGASGWWRVTADRRGLRVISALGWPRVVIPVTSIRETSAITVRPLADFGGWGWRWGAAGRRGIILRRGDAIQVTRESGKKFVVTVDDAQTAASVLAALVSANRLK